MIGVFSAVPARFQLVADVSGGAYSSESVRNVERLTAKFNTVAEGFVNVSQKKPKPKSKVRLPREKLTPNQRAQAYAKEQEDAETRLKQLRATVGKKVEKISKTRSRNIARLEKELERSKRERLSLISSFTVPIHAESEEDDDYDIDSDTEDEVGEDTHEDKEDDCNDRDDALRSENLVDQKTEASEQDPGFASTIERNAKQNVA